jgi:hypothetical protein
MLNGGRHDGTAGEVTSSARERNQSTIERGTVREHERLGFLGLAVCEAGRKASTCSAGLRGDLPSCTSSTIAIEASQTEQPKHPSGVRVGEEARPRVRRS